MVKKKIFKEEAEEVKKIADEDKKMKGEEKSPGPQGEEEKKAVKDLPEKPDPIISNLVSWPFKIWSRRNDLPALALNKEEADQLSLSINQLLTYYLPGISPISWVWVSLGMSASTIMAQRFELIDEIRKEKEEDAEEKTS